MSVGKWKLSDLLRIDSVKGEIKPAYDTTRQFDFNPVPRATVFDWKAKDAQKSPTSEEQHEEGPESFEQEV